MNSVSLSLFLSVKDVCICETERVADNGKERDKGGPLHAMFSKLQITFDLSLFFS